MATVEIIKSGETRVTIATMLPGSYGVTEGGLLYYRTNESACCISDVDLSYTGNAKEIDDKKVTILPKGTKIEITV